MMNTVLNECEVGDRIISGRVEAFSCKKSTADKKLAKSLQRHYQKEAAAIMRNEECSKPGSSSPQKQQNKSMMLLRHQEGGGNSCVSSSSSTPLGSLADAPTQKLLINLISTMNASFPDYDFSNVGPDHFVRCDFKSMRCFVNTQMSEMVEVLHCSGFLERLWRAIELVIQPQNCDVYSYVPEYESDPLSDRTLWSFNYFLYNKAQKKILYFTCTSRSKIYQNEEVDTESVSSYTKSDDSENECAELMQWEDGK